MLYSLYIDNYAFVGDEGDDRKTNTTEPYYYKNTLTMKGNEWGLID